MSSIPQREPLAEQIAALVKGSVALREDIADELSDHLACHAEQSGIKDSRVAFCEAAKAFGDPKEIARELRSIHMGGLIMFQRITIAVLAVLVIGLGCVAYLSWTSARRTDDQLAGLKNQLTALQSRQNQPIPLASQSVEDRPPRIRVYCFGTPPARPVAGQQIDISRLDPKDKERQSLDRRGQFGSEEGLRLKTGEDGRADTGPLPFGDYRMMVRSSAGGWTGLVRLWRYGQVEERSFNVQPKYHHSVRLDPASGVTWDTERMKVGLVFDEASVDWGQPSWWSNRLECGPLACEVKGLIPQMVVTPRAVLRGSSYSTRSSRDKSPQTQTNEYDFDLMPVRVPDDGQTIELTVPAYGQTIDPRIPLSTYRPVRGIVYDGSPDRPVANLLLEAYYVQASMGVGPISAQCIEYLRTDAQGRFGALSDRINVIKMDYKTADGKPAHLIWPRDLVLPATTQPGDQQPRMILDVSKLATVRVIITDWDRLAKDGLSVDYTPELQWDTYRDPRMPETPQRTSRQSWAWPTDAQGKLATSCDALVFAGSHDFHVQLSIQSKTGRQELPCTFQNVDAPAGQIVELRTSIDKLLGQSQPRSPAGGTPGSGRKPSS